MLSGYHRYSGNDRRRYERLDLDLKVVYRVSGPPIVRLNIGDKEIEATMLNLSLGGMALATEYGIPVWTLLDIKFSLSRMDKEGEVSIYKPMEITGEVRSSILLEDKEYRLGICFTGINDKDKLDLADFIKGIDRR